MMLLLALLLSTPSYAGEYPDAPRLEEYEGGALFDATDKLEIPEGVTVKLKENTDVQIDQVVINGTIVTEGYRLKIDTRKLVWGPNGKIVAFDWVPATPNQGKTGEAGHSGADHHHRRSNGGQGHEGKKGYAGADGPSGEQNPGEILIFAAQAYGTPVIDGTGQRGGNGGQGGNGGKGGKGGKGSKAEAQCWPWDDTEAGDGGAGGTGGPGGDGGNGGRGGRAVQITYYVSTLDPNIVLDASKIISVAGQGGSAGPAGAPGAGGDGGPGGDGDAAGCVFSTDHMGGGSPGPKGQAGGDGKAGREGVSGDLAKITTDNLHELETSRFNVFRAWYAFHWARNLNLLVRDSIRLTIDTALTRQQMSKIDKDEEDLFTKPNPAFAKAIARAWKANFVQPLQNVQSARILGVSIENAKSIGKMALALLEDMAAGKPAEQIKAGLFKTLEAADIEFNQKLDTASTQCLGYNELKKSSLDAFFGATLHYNVGACNGDPNFLKSENVTKPIKLGASLPTRITPMLLNWARGQSGALVAEKLSYVSPQASLGTRLFNWFGFEMAHADPYQVIVRPNLPLSSAVTRLGEPKREVIDGPVGTVLGYSTPSEIEVTREQLGRLLHVFALQTGAKQ